MSQFITGKITLQPNDEIGFSFKFPICSSTTVNDGCIPYGRVISSVDVKGFNSALEDVTNVLLEGSPTLSGDTVTAVLKYPGTDGRYSLRFILLLDNGWTREFDFTTIYAKNL